ncbi:MAG TPA: DUF4249 domain-containing protein [Bacteroidales bacterium]|nr:DUF4249 domain-containing protein [Bacteroidales bacterium]
MSKSISGPLILLVVVFSAVKCVDPYTPKLSGYRNVMVVDGLVTNADNSYKVSLTESIEAQDSTPKTISDATVYITDDNGVRTDLLPAGNGIYKTDSLTFRGETGRTYQLHITRSDGNEYVSDSCKMLPVPEIDTVYFFKDSRLYNNQTVLRQGISIFLDSKEPQEENNYLRWTFDETWKFRIPYPTSYVFLNDSTINSLPPSEIKEFCWRTNKNTEILTREINPGSTGPIKGVPITFIASELSGRLLMRYSIIIHQYSVSRNEYNFWNNLKMVEENLGDLFGKQPFAVASNIKNKRDPSEMVLGYFQVSSVSEKRIYLDFLKDIEPLNLPVYLYPCQLITVSPMDFYDPTSRQKPMTFEQMYNMFINSKRYSFVEPVYDPTTYKLSKLSFTTIECADCEKSGSSVTPYFWTDK